MAKEAKTVETVESLSGRLKKVRRARGRYDNAQVNWIREAYLIEERTLKSIQGALWPTASENAIYKIATGLTYKEVPMTERLLEAYHKAEQRRMITSAPGPGTRPAAGPVRAAELLEGGENWD